MTHPELVRIAEVLYAQDREYLKMRVFGSDAGDK